MINHMQSVNIIVGSQMGSAEYVAEQLAEADPSAAS